MNMLRFSFNVVTTLGVLIAISFACSTCRAVNVNFIADTVPPIDGDFNSGTNWSDGAAPSANFKEYFIQDNLTARISSGSPAVHFLTIGDTSFGRLEMTGGTVEVLPTFSNRLEVGRSIFLKTENGDYNHNGKVDAPDYTVWRDTFGSEFDLAADGDGSGFVDQGDYDVWKGNFGRREGGEIVMTGSSVLKADGAVVGTRSKGSLFVGPLASVDLKNALMIRSDMRIGSFGPGFDDLGNEPGLNGNGFVEMQGSLNAATLIISQSGAIGEFRFDGGNVNLTGGLWMNLCENCFDATKRSSKVSVVGSGGVFNIGLDPVVVDPTPPTRDILAASPTAMFSFTADAGGVTPIVIAVSSVAANSGTARIDTSKLELNLDAFPFTPTSTLTLIDAAPGRLVGMFGAVNFLGNTTATVNYDVTNGNVFLSNFQNGAGGGSLAGAAVPEPSSLVLIMTLGFFLISFGAGANRQRARLWGFQCQKIRA